MQPHVVVIGAGIVGASCAYHLSERGAQSHGSGACQRPGEWRDG